MRYPHTIPAPDQLWLARPPFLLLARVRAVVLAPQATIEYELLDVDGSALSGPVREALDEGWWQTFRPLVQRRYG